MLAYLNGLLHHPKTVTAVLVISQLCLKAYLVRRRRRNSLPLPPGPKGYPIIGNLLDIPSENAGQGYSKLSERYGDMIYLESMGTRLLVVSSLKRTRDLFDTKSSIYSSRWDMPMLDIMGYRAYFSMMPYGAVWRRQRQLFHEHFNPTVVRKYHPMILEESAKFVGRLLAKPDDFSKLTRTLFTTIILRSTYGIQPTGDDDPFITTPAKAMEGFIIAALPGRFLVDIIPSLSYLPDWFPGTAWKQFAKIYLQANWETRVEPYVHVREQMSRGEASPSALCSMIENLPPSDDASRESEETNAQDTAAMSYLAGSDTSLSTGLAAFLLLACHPEVQRRAQREIDEVVGSERLPNFSDRDQLVYINALVKEIFRIHQPLPLALPHATTEDDIYDGYFIPKGTIVIGNSWQILHDPTHFPDPFSFKPERFIRDNRLRKDILDPYGPGFGYGRRICPGRHISIDSVFAMIASTLAVFDIEAPKDEQGNISLKFEVTDGIVVAPKEFQCKITPRSPQHAELIKSVVTSY